MPSPDLGNYLLPLAKQALQAARGWIINGTESALARRDLRLVDSVLSAFDRDALEPDLSSDNSIDQEALYMATHVSRYLKITHPQQIAKIQVVLTDAIKASQELKQEELVNG